jgi:hypothetical protein
MTCGPTDSGRLTDLASEKAMASPPTDNVRKTLDDPARER